MTDRLPFSRLLFALGCLAAAPLAGCGSHVTGDVLADTGAGQGPMAVGPGGIFVVESSQASSATPLARIPLAGGTPALLDPGASSVFALALEGDSAFYGALDFQLPGPPVWSFTIERVPQAGGAPQTVVTDSRFLLAMTVGGGSLVYTTMDSDPFKALGAPEPGSGAVWIQPIAPLGQAPAAPVEIAQGLPQPCALAADDARAYWLDCTTQQLLSVPLGAQAGEAPAVLASGLKVDFTSGAWGPQLAVAAGHLYWFEGVAVRTVPVGGGAPSTLASEVGWVPSLIVADGEAVYWMTTLNAQVPDGDSSDDWQPSVWAAPAGGGAVTRAIGPDLAPAAVAIDPTFLYWIDDDDGTVRRVGR